MLGLNLLDPSAKNIAGAAVGLATLLGVVATSQLNRRALTNTVLAETAKLTTDPIASARDKVGLILESEAAKADRSVTPPLPTTLQPPEILAFFAVLWGFERLNAFHTSLGRRWLLSSRPTVPQRLLLDSVGAAVDTWAGYISPRGAIAGVDADHSSKGLQELVRKREELERRGPNRKGRHAKRFAGVSESLRSPPTDQMRDADGQKGSMARYFPPPGRTRG